MTEYCGMLVNSFIGIIYSDTTDIFAAVAARKATELQQQMAAELEKKGI